MFSLIISIIAIALVAALAGASVYYGGSAFNKGTAGADASTAVNAGQQINGAAALATNDGASFAAVADLVSAGYLSQAPSYKGTALTLDTTNHVAKVLVSDAVCKEIVNSRGGEDAAIINHTKLFGCNVTSGAAATPVGTVDTFWYSYQ